MAKRGEKYERIERDYYRTIDPRAVAALAPHLRPGTRFVEPCAGAGDLVDALEAAGHACIIKLDIEPQREGISQADALGFRIRPGINAPATIITNPPWRRDLLHMMIPHFAGQAETWLLFDADWMHTQQATQFEPILTDIVSVGRLRWFAEDDPRSKGTDPRDNCAWYRFAHDKYGATRFWPRT